MADFNLVYLAFVPLVLLLIGLVPSRVADAHVARMRPLSILACTFGLFSSVAAMAYLLTTGIRSDVWFLTTQIESAPLGIYFDSLSAVMLVLIQFIGLVIAGYSIRYLDGDAAQGRFIRWICFTIGSVSLMVMSHHLALFAVAWTMTSIGLHKLLIHYGDRKRAVVAARKKFLISRLGDVFLIAAIVLTFNSFGTLVFEDIFALTASVQGSAVNQSLAVWIGPLLVLGAMTKSAQFPFHSWLPDTMETPTPVSALMHAGIINAGGFLIIRLSPLVSLSSGSLHLLAVVGAITAVFGATVMLTQTSIKKSLAYSTIAQMGFMMLQCGLGNFSAALLHIVGHSLYKAYAFLNAGSVIDTANRLQTDIDTDKRDINRLLAICLHQALPLAIAVASIIVAADFLGLNWFEKPGAMLLGLVLVFAIATANSKAIQSRRFKPIVTTIIASLLTSLAYCGGYSLTDALLATTQSHTATVQTSWQVPLSIAFALLFAGLFVLQSGLDRWRQTRLLQNLYVAALNGFYFDTTAQRISEQIWSRNASRSRDFARNVAAGKSL